MKTKIIFPLVIFLMAQNLLAETICKNGNSKVVLNENYSMKVSGLETEGIETGLYHCSVVGMGPGLGSVQRAVQCEKNNSPEIVVMGWMIEGVDLYGRQAASFALYSEGEKVFEAACSRK